uniref:Odorant-binding protein n=1 Tax=Anopheles culicifacies TaxID=139723 RepID=A0A182M2X5_9DIPT
METEGLPRNGAHQGANALIEVQDLAVTLAALACGHGYETKSIAHAYLECLQYLNISRQSMYAYDSTAVPSNTGGNCLMRCIGLNTRWWNDETGLNEKALVRFFRQTDPNALEQARTCLANVSSPSDTCAAAYRSFRCYSDALGEVIAHPEYVAPSREEIRRAVGDCAAMLQVSDEQVTSCVAGESFLHSGNATALLRCVVLRLGLYADSTGVMCDRVQLLMDSDTALAWTEAHTEEAKRCENDLRELGADVCLVAAHSVEVCYGWKAFGELWKVLQEEYGNVDDAMLYNPAEEPLEESNDAAEVEQEPENNAIYPTPQEVEVFSYPSKSPYKSLLILAPKWIADGIISDSSDSSSAQDEKTPEDGKPETHELSEVNAEKSEPAEPENAENAVQQQPEPEESKEPETEHIVQTRSVMHPMAPEIFSYYRAVLPPYELRMRRSIPLSPYHPHALHVMGTHYSHPMLHPVVKRSIPMEPMFVPVCGHFHGPARFVRDVNPPVPHVQLDLVEDELVPLFDEDSDVSRNEEQDMEASSDSAEQPSSNRVDGEEGTPAEDVSAQKEDSSVSVAEAVQNDAGDAHDETEPEDSSTNAAGEVNIEDNVNDAQTNANEQSDDALPDKMESSADEANVEEAVASDVPQDQNTSSASTDNTVPAPKDAADSTSSGASNLSVAEERNAPEPKSIHPLVAQRIIRAIHSTPLLRNLLSSLTARRG